MHPAVIAVLGILVVTNLVCFCMMGYDKYCARKGRWRVPEATLFIACAFFGGIGGVLGMRVFRHKTRHWYFKLFFPLLMIVQIVVIILLANLVL